MNTKAVSILGLAFAFFAFAARPVSAQEAGSIEQAVNRLIPGLGATNIGQRYGAQMDLQALALNSARLGAGAERTEVAKILAAKATDASVSQPARVWLVRQLEYIGDAESAVSLASLLNGPDAELKECARRALEKNPAPAAGEVLRTALRQGGHSDWKIGLIQSLGERGDLQAVALIQPYLAEPKIGGAAALALAKIASDDSIKALWESFDGGNSAAAEALVVAGGRLTRSGKRVEAAKIFSRLYHAETGPGGAAPTIRNPAVAARLRSAALVGLAKADPNEARKHIFTELEGNDPRLQYAAVTAAGIVFTRDKLSAQLAPLLPKLSSSAKIYVLRQLDATVEAQVAALAEDPDESVRVAAFESLGQIGGAASVPVLAKAAAAGTSPAQKAAMAGLGRCPGPGADDAIAKLAEAGDPAARAAAIRALAVRNNKDRLPALMKYAGESDSQISQAAFWALGILGTDDEIEGLARFAVKGNTPGADAALQMVASRAKDKPAATRKLTALAPPTDPRLAGLLFETLTVLGGGDAFATVTNAVSSANEEVRDAAIRALANWPDFAATGPLLVIAYDPAAKPVHQVLAIQGVVRLVKSSENERAEARLAAAKAAMSAASRDADRRLVISAYAAVPDARAAEAIKPYLNDAKLGKEAALAGVALARSLRTTDNTAAKDLAQAVRDANVSEELTRQANAFLQRN